MEKNNCVPDVLEALSEVGECLICKELRLLKYTMNKHGLRGCSGITTRHGVRRFCAQKAVVSHDGKRYCWYHNPRNPHKFGEGYFSDIKKNIKKIVKKWKK